MLINNTQVSSKPVVSFANKSFVKLPIYSLAQEIYWVQLILMHDGILHCSLRNAVKQ